ncbi:MAG: hypothetical protein M1840_008639 [Geoglossum simile]|nr:MAG: hypothetical protein M1840_008639 [Geoglossum simile]
MQYLNDLPIVDSRTHIISLLGITDANPAGDGWFASDYCLFYHLFRGLGKSQTWVTCLDFVGEVTKHGDIIHRYPFQTRKVVCSQSLRLEQGLEVFSPDSLLGGFLSSLERICRNADADDRVLVMIFGHGSDDPQYVLTGTGRLTIDDFIRAIQPARTETKDLLVCLLMTSCYSGGWITDSFNASVIAAADNETESDSIRRSGSQNYRGSIFSLAVINELFKPETSISSAEPASFDTFTEGVEKKMEELFSVGAKPRFAPQGGLWSASLESTTGTVRAMWQKRYDELPSVPPDPHPDNLDADTRLTGNIQALSRIYLDLRPGYDEKPSNMWIHGQISRAHHGSLKPQDAVLLLRSLRYRIALALAAEHFVSSLNLHPFPSFDFYDDREWKMARTSDSNEAARKAWKVIGEFDLFPGPECTKAPSQRPFPKPRLYLAAAFAAKGLDEMEVRRRVEEYLEKDAISAGERRRRVGRLSDRGSIS